MHPRLVFSIMSTLPHTAYLAMLAPPAAALAAAGICTLAHVYRAGRPSGWLLPAAVLTEVLWAWFLWRDYRGFLPWALPAALAAGVVTAVVLVAARLAHRFPQRVADAVLALGVAAMLAAPAAWTASVLDPSYGGTSFDASAGPADGHGLFTLFQGPVLDGVFGSTQTLTPQTQAVDDYVNANRHGAADLLAVPSWTQASRFILATGQEAMPLGGFSGTVRTPRWPGCRTCPRRPAAVLLDRLVRRARHRRRGPEIGHGWADRLLGTQHLHPGPHRRLRRPARRLRQRKRRGGAL